MSNLRKAARQKAKIRLGLSAVSGGGKTYSAILLAKGLTGGDLSKMAIIDTENGSADLYSHMGDYNVLPLLPPYSPERYIDAIQECESAGMEVIIIDSIAHEWEGEGGVLQLCDQIGGGFQTAWKQLTPRHDKFKNAILSSKCHIITTVRRKQEYILVEELNRQGKSVQKPVKAGMKEITREGWEYELTINLEIDNHHLAKASKDRTELFSGKEPFVISEETGKAIRQWCENGFDIEGEVNIAINNLSGCATIDALSILKKGLADYIITNERFKEAGRNRYNELLSHASAPASTAPVQQQAPASQSAEAITPFSKQYSDINALYAVVKTANKEEELSALYLNNQSVIDGSDLLRDAIAAKRVGIKNQGKVIITSKQYGEVCDRLRKGDASIYDSAINTYILNQAQVEEMQHIATQARLLEEALTIKYNNPADISRMIASCQREDQLTRLHSNNAMIIDRDGELMTVLNARLKVIKAATAAAA